MKTDTATRFVRVRPLTQVAVLMGGSAMLGWSVFATATVMMDQVGAGGAGDQTAQEQAAYESRLNQLAQERDARAEEARRAQARFAAALDEVSAMQTELLAAEERRAELETGLETVQATLRRTVDERDAALDETARITARHEATETREATAPERLAEAQVALDVLSATLKRTAIERDTLAGLAAEQGTQIDDLVLEAQLVAERNDHIFDQLEDAVSVSVEPLDGMFAAVGLDPEALIEQVRADHQSEATQGAISISTKGGPLEPEAARANDILARLDKLGLYAEAARRAPFSEPLHSSYRLTSGFGPRWGRMHEGTDFAGAHGSPVLATADGVVTYSGTMSGYGKVVKIEHDFGTETLYGHNSALHVTKGQRVSRGDHIADMGNTGRSTGTHLHYEVIVDGSPVDPMSYIKAARDVF